jgi:Uri superfamily endonuclease
MPKDSGLYQLLIFLPESRSIRVGKLGDFRFPSGYYVYTGSAKRGLNARIARHVRRRKKSHWHIDYLLRYGNIVKVLRYENGKESECKLNRRLDNESSGKIIAPEFGSSDCKCTTHLFHLEKLTERFSTNAEKS